MKLRHTPDKTYPYRDREKKRVRRKPFLIQIPKSIIASSICILKYLKADGIYLNLP